MSSTPQKRVAVIGAGIAGLTAAYELQKSGFDVTVFEKGTQVGGRMSSRVKDDFVFDLGADHLCNLYEEMKKYCAEFGIQWEKMRFLQYGMFRAGKIVQLDKAVSVVSRLRMALAYLLMPKPEGALFDLGNFAALDNEDAYTYMKRRAGQEVADYLVDSYVSTYQFHRATEISAGALMGVFHSLHKDHGEWKLHRTQGGMQALPDAFASRLNVKLATPVETVTAGDRVVVRTSSVIEEFDAAVLASPANVTNAIYKNPTEPQKQLLASTKYASTISLAFQVDRKLMPDVAVVWVPFVENDKISGYVNEAMKGEEAHRDGTALVCVWLHEGFAKSIMEKNDAEIFDLVKNEFLHVCPWFASASQLENHDLQRWSQAMPKFLPGHLRTVEAFLANGQGDQNIFFCGDYMNSLWTEGAIRGGQRVAEQLKRKLGV